ncbi:MAG: carbon-nitrogen hydrolase family protein [Alphaproteobacteria bacterium]|nr:carbon-nitrogen hydrolase family protein [Alphaproteobacteria bacterium]
MTPFAIAGIQMYLTVGNNIEVMRQRLDLTMHLYPWVQMVLFSELACFGPLLGHAQPLPGEAEAAFQEMATRHRIWLLNGSMYERKDGAIHNTTSIIDPSGRVVGRYRKMFPFTPLEQGVTPGEEFFAFEVEGVGKFGVLNCYDLWFPETARQLTASGVEVILHPVMTHTIDRDLDLAVAQASSAMFQTYIFDINGLGAGGNGRSAVYDSNGRALYQGDVSEQIIPIEIDLDTVRRQRKNGIRGLGQPLKSFRDRPVDFPVYDRDGFDTAYLDGLGPLAQPRREGAPAANVQSLPVRRSLLK